MTLTVEQLESRDCPSSPADLWVSRYRGLPDEELQRRAYDAQVRASALVVDADATRTRTGVLEYSYDLLRATDRFMRLRRVNAEIQAIVQIRHERGQR